MVRPDFTLQSAGKPLEQCIVQPTHETPSMRRWKVGATLLKTASRYRAATHYVDAPFQTKVNCMPIFQAIKYGTTFVKS
eukprot:5480185-Pyramimonas_sp.AAC.2